MNKRFCCNCYSHIYANEKTEREAMAETEVESVHRQKYT